MEGEKSSIFYLAGIIFCLIGIFISSIAAVAGVAILPFFRGEDPTFKGPGGLPILAGECSEIIISQAERYAGIPYSRAEHCGPVTIGPEGVSALDCSGFISRVYRDLDLFPSGLCLTTATIPNSPYLKGISPQEIQPGDLVLSTNPGHVVIYVSGDVTKNFQVWESGGEDPGCCDVRKTTRQARPNQTYYRARSCD